MQYLILPLVYYQFKTNMREESSHVLFIDRLFRIFMVLLFLYPALFSNKPKVNLL